MPALSAGVSATPEALRPFHQTSPPELPVATMLPELVIRPWFAPAELARLLLASKMTARLAGKVSVAPGSAGGPRLKSAGPRMEPDPPDTSIAPPFCRVMFPAV